MHDGTVVIPAAPGWYVLYFEPGGDPDKPSVAYVVAWDLRYTVDGVGLCGDLCASTAIVVVEGADGEFPACRADDLPLYPGAGGPWLSRKLPDAET